MSTNKKKIGGCKKKRRTKKISKGQRRSIAKPFGRPSSHHGAQRVR